MQLEKSLDRFISLGSEAKDWALPEKFTYPFHYEPHPLAKIAATDFQERYMSTIENAHAFWRETTSGTGKMIGVLVVLTQDNKLGYIAAFSGKLSSGNHIYPFVPPVYDMLSESGFYKQEEAILNGLNHQISLLESSQERQRIIEELVTVLKEGEEAVLLAKQNIELQRNERKNKRQQFYELGLLETEITKANLALDEESKTEQIALKGLKRHWREKEEALKSKLEEIDHRIAALKQERKALSANVQQRLFQAYSFLNIRGERKSLLDIFGNSAEQQPPSGAGECAAPKLLHYAFLQGWRPVCMAEFWWGESPKSEVRHHGTFYPACRSKCKPILQHMLDGVETDPDPLMRDREELKEMPLVFEDQDIIAVNKPPGLLSVPGKSNLPSVYTILQEKYPTEKIYMVHRLDMSTSGVLLVARNLDTYHQLQEQFASRQVKKRYVALLNGFLNEKSGEIKLPLRVDLDDRPRQLVCYEHGLSAHTRWKVCGEHAFGSRVYFYPITGRTHQLRVHAAHQQGLGCPIVGDDLYGQMADRLYLHAEAIDFVHPTSGQTLRLRAPASF